MSLGMCWEGRAISAEDQGGPEEITDVIQEYWPCLRSMEKDVVTPKIVVLSQ